MSAPAVVQLSRLSARDELGAVIGLDLALPAGPIGALIGTPRDGTSAVARVLSGCIEPTGGSVTIAGHAPYRSPSTRQRIGALLDAPTLPDVGQVRRLFIMARTIRGGQAIDRDMWWSALGLAELERASVASLEPAQRRSVALGLALSVPNPLLLVLQEPLTTAGSISASQLAAVLQTRARAGACVLVLSASVDDAVELADDVATLRAGRIARAIGAPEPEALFPGSWIEFQIWCDKPRALASSLSLEPVVHALTWTESAGTGTVVARTDQLQACAEAAARCALQSGVNVFAMRPVLPGCAEALAVEPRSSSAPPPMRGIA